MLEPFSLKAAKHRQGASGLHVLIVLIFGLLALVCIAGGIFAICLKDKSETSFNILGAHLKTGSVGVALVALGLVVAFFVVQAVLRSQQDLAKLSPKSNEQTGATTITQTNIKTGGDNAGRDINKR